MKVLTMLLGEFDFVDLMVDDPTTPWMAKVLFAAFLVVMSIVLMNLVVGLAISDIAALRHEAHIRKIVSLMMAIQKTECLSGLFHRMLPTQQILRTQITSQATCDFDEKIFLNLQMANKLSRGSAELVVEKATGEMERHICPAELVVKVKEKLRKRGSLAKLDQLEARITRLEERQAKGLNYS